MILATVEVRLKKVSAQFATQRQTHTVFHMPLSTILFQ